MPIIVRTIKPWLPTILFILIGSGIYSNSLDVPFIFDDARNLQHQNLRIDELSLDKIIKAGSQGELITRPVANISFAFNYWLSGTDVKSYHLFNIIIHILAGITLYHFFFLTTTLPTLDFSPDKARIISLFSSLIWFVNPIQTQAVTYLVQRMTSMSALFYIMSLTTYIIGRRISLGLSLLSSNKKNELNIAIFLWYFISFVTAILAIGSKEIAATLPCFIFLYEWYFFQDLNWKWLKKKLPWLLGSLMVLTILALFYMGWHPIDYINRGYRSRDFNLSERFLTQFRVIVHYITLFLFPSPSRLTFDYNFPLSSSLISPITTLFSAIGILLLAFTAILTSRSQRIVSFCIFWFLGNLLIESSVIALEIIFEHRLYLPSMMLSLLLVLLFLKAFENLKVVSLLITALLALFCFWTFDRNKIWQDPIIFWQDSVIKSPGKARAHNNLGTEWYNVNEIEKAKNEYLIALEIDPQYGRAHLNLSTIYYLLDELDNAYSHALQAIQFNKNKVDAYNNIAVILLKSNRIPEAEQYLRDGLAIEGDNVLLLGNLGKMLLNSNKANDALQYLEKALKKSPDSQRVMEDLADNYLILGFTDKASKVYKKILELDSSQPVIHSNLAMVLMTQNNQDEALTHYQEAVSLGGESDVLFYNIGNILLRQGKSLEAISYYQKSLIANPENANAHNNIGLAFMKTGDLSKAYEHFSQTVQLEPGNNFAREALQHIEEIRLNQKK